MRTMFFWMRGTFSGGTSTPRSPRATMIASDSLAISRRCCTAEGFSILAMRKARSPISLRASWMSCGRCTNDSATQSTPSSRPKVRSWRSFAVSGESSSTASGTFTPLRSDSSPPATTRVSMASAWRSTTVRRRRPSSISSCMPGSSAAMISGCGRFTRRLSPGVGSRSRRKAWSRSRRTLPAAKRPTLSLGPCRSMRMPIGWFSSCSTWRIQAKRSVWSLCSPWLKFRRNRFTPASTSARTSSTLRVAGPRVARILTFLSCVMAVLWGSCCSDACLNEVEAVNPTTAGSGWRESR